MEVRLPIGSLFKCIPLISLDDEDDCQSLDNDSKEAANDVDNTNDSLSDENDIEEDIHRVVEYDSEENEVNK